MLCRFRCSLTEEGKDQVLAVLGRFEHGVL
jgi:hypothetical protein